MVELWTPPKDLVRFAQRHVVLVDLWDHDPRDGRDHVSCRGCRPFKTEVAEVSWSAPDGTIVTKASDPDQFYEYERKYRQQFPEREDQTWVS